MTPKDIALLEEKIRTRGSFRETVEKRLSDPPIVGALLQNPTEDNIALAFGECFKNKYVFIHGVNRWYQWTGNYWRKDSTGKVMEDIRSLARAYNIQGKSLPAKHSFVAGVEKHLRSDRTFAREAQMFDSDNYLLNCPDGTYDLRTMQRHSHSPDDCITQITSTAPSETGGTRFLQFLREVTCEDAGLENFLQIALGACLSGAVEEHWLLFWIGRSRAGKNTLGEAILAVLGDYARPIPGETLMSARYQPHPTAIMDLKGKRLVTSSEIDEGSYWAEAKIKEVTGDEFLSGRSMHQDWVNFRRTHKHIIYGNHRPLLRNVDDAIRARIKIVPFKASFLGREDPNLKAKLSNEKGYILYWLLEGHQKWLVSGKKIGTCSAVEAESTDYFSNQTSIEAWLEEHCVAIQDEGQPGRYWPQAGALYSDFKAWMESRGDSAPNQTRFGEQLGQRFQKVRVAGVRYVGVQLKNSVGNQT